MQLLAPDAYAALQLPDQWIEDAMQEKQAEWLVEMTDGCKYVLDMGYGSGIICKALSAYGKFVTLVDGSAEFCTDASYIPRVQSVHSMFEDFNPTGKFDCVIASFILEHVSAPVALLKRMRQWSKKLIVVVGNAGSYHRRIAVQMGIQPYLDSLSARDKTVGHHFVYSRHRIYDDLLQADWTPVNERGLMLKVLPNSMLAKLDPAIVKVMAQMEVDPEYAANLILECK